MAQQIFNPIKYGFEWTTDGWYKFDVQAAEKKALGERNAEIKRLKAAGRKPKAFTLSKQQMTHGGIGSGHPEISVVVSVYGINCEES